MTGQLTLSLLSRILPHLLNGLLRGGLEPHVIRIMEGDVSNHDLNQTDVYAHATIDCSEYGEDMESFYTGTVTDLVVVVQCKGDQSLLLEKINNILIKNPSVFGRPNVIVILESVATFFSHNFLTRTYLINTILQISDVKVTKNGHISAKVITDIRSPSSSRYSINIDLHDSQLDDSLVKKRPLSFKGTTVNVTSSIYPPFVKRVTDNNGSISYTGFAFSVLEVISKSCDFQYTVETTNVYGSQLTDGSWNGMIGLVQRQAKDLAVAGLTITGQRSTAVDFTYPFWFEPNVGVVKTSSNKLFYLLGPFHTDVWQIFTGIFLFSVICAAAMDIFHKKHFDENFSAKVSFVETVWAVMPTWFSQGITKPSDSFIVRIMSSLISLCLLIFWGTYTGNLIASLTVYKPILPLRSLQELADSYQYLPLTRFGTAAYGLFKDSKSGVYAKLWKRSANNLPHTVCYGNCEELFSDKDNLVFLADKSAVLNAMDMVPDCETEMIPGEFYPSGFGIAMPLNSPYKPFFDNVIRNMAENGLLLKFEKIHKLPDRCEILRGRRTKNQAFTIPEVLVLFLILGCGTLVSSLVLLCECLVCLVKREFSKFN